MRELTEEQVQAALQEYRDDLLKQYGADEAAILTAVMGEEAARKQLGCNQDRLPAFIDGNTDPDETRQFKEHLEVCPFCREEVEGTREMIEMWKQSKLTS